MLRLIREAEEVENKVEVTDAETEKVEPVAVEKTSEEDNSIETATAFENSIDPEIENEMVKKSCEASINSLIEGIWNFISEINSTISTLTFNYKENNKDDIINILDSIVNDLTINIGMLYKCSNIMDEKTAELIETGKEKAEDITSSDENSTTEKTSEENVE